MQRAPVVLVTGADPSEAAEAARSVGAAGVLLKPFTLDELLACLHRAMHPAAS